MLSIGVMKTAGWEYYAREVADGLEDYYTGAGEAPGVWTGGGATAAGISGTVTAEALALAFDEARHPASGEPLDRPWRPDGVIGFDVTFSAPKSVSLLFALGDPVVRAQVRAAHVAAVEDAGLAYLEDHAAFTRRGRNGVMVTDTDGLVIARFEHRTSRALDPQLHSHCLVLNKVRDAQDGSWRALHGRPLFEEAKTAGMLYQAALRAELTRRLGVAWGPVSEHGQAELAGIPHQLLARFSTRTAEVEAAAEAKIAELEAALGRALEPDERGRVYRLAVLATCRPKAHEAIGEVSLYERWALEARETGWEPADVVRLPLAAATPRCAAHVRPRAPCSRRASCASSGRRSPAATSSKRSAATSIPRSARMPLRCASTLSGVAEAILADPVVRPSATTGTRRPTADLGASRRCQRLGPARRDPLHDPRHARRRGSHSARRAGRSRRRRRGRLCRDSRPCRRGRTNAARHRSVRRAPRHHEPGPTHRSRDRSRRHRQDHHAARRHDRLDRHRPSGDRPRPHRGRRRTAAHRSSHARRDRRQVPRHARPRRRPPGWQLTPRHVVVVDEAEHARHPRPRPPRRTRHTPRRQTRPRRRRPPTRRHPRTRRHVRRPRRHPRRASSCARRTASPTLGKPTPSPNYATEPPTGSARSRRTGASTAALNLKHNVTASPAGGPATTPGETRSCSPTTTPRHTNSPRKHERPASSQAKFKPAASACAPTSAPRPSAWATTSRPVRTIGALPTDPTNGSATTTAGSSAASTNATARSRSSGSATAPASRCPPTTSRTTCVSGVRDHHRCRAGSHRRRDPRRRHVRDVSQRALHRAQPRPTCEPCVRGV